MAKPSERNNKPEALKRIGDYVQKGVGAQLEGEKVELENYMGQELVLKDFVFIPSTKFQQEGKKSEFAVIQFTLPGSDKLMTISCGGGAVVDSLKQMPKQYLPIAVTFKWQKSPQSGRRYITIE